MTPAEKAGLKVGDKIRVITYDGVFLQGGDILKFKEDDETGSPWFTLENREGELDVYAYSINDKDLNEWKKVEENNMNKEFKAMKFWFEVGEVDLRDKVITILEGLGYKKFSNILPNPPTITGKVIQVDKDGLITTSSSSKEDWWFKELANHEEINIDWMRAAPKRSIVKIGNKSYYEDELAEALSGINEVKP